MEGSETSHGRMERRYDLDGRRATSDELAADAMAADMDRWITFVPSEHAQVQGAFTEWLQDNLPSSLSRTDGIGWISVRSNQESAGSSSGEDTTEDVMGLQESWEQLRESGRTINQPAITQLAKKHGVTSGKWLFHASTGLKVDHLWMRIAAGVVEGRCGIGAKVSPCNPYDDSENHVICVYNSDYTDYDQVMDLENSIRSVGIKAQLMYKPDVYTKLGIYRNNEWGLIPTIYRSVFDILQGCSKVKDTDSFADMANYPNHPHI